MSIHRVIAIAGVATVLAAPSLASAQSAPPTASFQDPQSDGTVALPNRVVANAHALVGGVARISVTFTAAGPPTPVTIQRLSSGRWRTVIRAAVTPVHYRSGPVFVGHLRMRSPGTVRLRAIANGHVTPTRTLTAIAARYPTTALPLHPAGIEAAKEGVWVYGGGPRPGSGYVRQLNPATGRTAQQLRLDAHDIALGAGYLYAVNRTALTRRHITSGQQITHPITALGLHVTANDTSAWIGGLCTTAPSPCIPEARRLDDITAAPTGPTATPSGVQLVGTTLWLTGRDNYSNDDPRDDYYHVFAADPLTGITTGQSVTSPVDLGSPRPLTATTVWAQSELGELIQTLPSYRQIDLAQDGYSNGHVAVSGNGAWILQTRRVGTSRRHERLVQINITTAKRTGRIIDVGTYPNRWVYYGPSQVVIHNKVAWILRYDAAVTRVPLT